jgi:hypothetical protein
MFGYKSRAQIRREVILVRTGWTIVALFLIGVGETIYKVATGPRSEKEGATDYNEWSRGE